MQERSLFVILILICLASCEIDRDEYIKTRGNALLKITVDSTKIEADGVSIAQVQAVLSPDADKRIVSFVADYGEFGDSSKETQVEATFKEDVLSANANLKASLDVKDNVKVTASISGITEIATLKFVKAYPDSMQLESTIASIESGFGSEVPLQVFLIRTKGITSLHHQVSFRAIQLSNAPLGEFRAIDAAGSNNRGVIGAIYVLKDTIYRGPVRIIASTETKSGIYNDTLIINVIKK